VDASAPDTYVGAVRIAVDALAAQPHWRRGGGDAELDSQRDADLSHVPSAVAFGARSTSSRGGGVRVEGCCGLTAVRACVCARVRLCQFILVRKSVDGQDNNTQTRARVRARIHTRTHARTHTHAHARTHLASVATVQPAGTFDDDTVAFPRTASSKPTSTAAATQASAVLTASAAGQLPSASVLTPLEMTLVLAVG
jgi:hypothetical protein